MQYEVRVTNEVAALRSGGAGTRKIRVRRAGAEDLVLEFSSQPTAINELYPEVERDPHLRFKAVEISLLPSAQPIESSPPAPTVPTQGAGELPATEPGAAVAPAATFSGEATFVEDVSEPPPTPSTQPSREPPPEAMDELREAERAAEPSEENDAGVTEAPPTTTLDRAALESLGYSDLRKLAIFHKLPFMVTRDLLVNSLVARGEQLAAQAAAVTP
jgi:hypothetical protein